MSRANALNAEKKSRFKNIQCPFIAFPYQAYYNALSLGFLMPRRILTFLFALTFVAIATGGLTLHHHDEPGHSGDCETCYLLATSVQALILVFVIIYLLELQARRAAPIATFWLRHRRRHTSSAPRAPPRN